MIAGHQLGEPLCCFIVRYAPSVSDSLLFSHSVAVFPLNVGYSSVFTVLDTLVVLVRLAIFPHPEAVICFLLSATHMFAATSLDAPWCLVHSSTADHEYFCSETLTLVL